MDEIELGDETPFQFSKISEVSPEAALVITTPNHDATHLTEGQVIELIDFLNGDQRLSIFRDKLFASAKEQNRLACAIITLMERHGIEGEVAERELLDAMAATETKSIPEVGSEKAERQALELHRAGTDLWEMVEPLVRKAREWKEHRMLSNAPLNTREQGLYLAIRTYDEGAPVHPVEALRDLAMQEAERFGLGVDHESFDRARELTDRHDETWPLKDLASLTEENEELRKILGDIIPHATKHQLEVGRLREEWALLWAAVTMLDPKDIQRISRHVLKLRTLPPPESIVADELDANEKRRANLAAGGG